LRDFYVTTKEIPKRELRVSIDEARRELGYPEVVTTKEIPKRELRDKPIPNISQSLIYAAESFMLQQKKSQKGN
jgi:hypothetical protein